MCNTLKDSKMARGAKNYFLLLFVLQTRAVLPIMAYTERLPPERILFSGLGFIKGWRFQELKYMKG